MALTREQIEHIEKHLPWAQPLFKLQNNSHSRKWLKRQMNKWIRLNKFKLLSPKKVFKGWEY